MNSPEDRPFILLVDDDAVIRLDLASALGDEGFAVLAVANAGHAVRVLSAVPGIQVLIADSELSGVTDGEELAWMVRQKWPAVQIIVVSRKHRALELDLPQGSQVFCKPYEPERLARAIDALISSGQPARGKRSALN